MNGFNELVDLFLIPGLRRTHDHQEGCPILAGERRNNCRITKPLSSVPSKVVTSTSPADGHLLHIYHFHLQAAPPRLLFKRPAHLFFHLLLVGRHLNCASMIIGLAAEEEVVDDLGPIITMV